MTDDGPKVTFGEGAEEFVIEAHGWATNDRGFIVDEDGDIVTAVYGGSIRLDELAGVVSVEGEPTPLRDDFTSICQYVKDYK